MEGNYSYNRSHYSRCLKKNLNKSGSRITLIVNHKKEFQGTISDGDIRRALINRVEQNASIQKIINKNALIVSPEIKHEIVLGLILKNKIQQIPIINKNNKIVGLYFWDDTKELVTLNKDQKKSCQIY